MARSRQHAAPECASDYFGIINLARLRLSVAPPDAQNAVTQTAKQDSFELRSGA